MRCIHCSQILQGFVAGFGKNPALGVAIHIVVGSGIHANIIYE
jgi:hypothetical protein